MFSKIWNLKIFSSAPYTLEAGQLIDSIIVIIIGFFAATLIKKIITRKLSTYLNEEFDHRLILIQRTSYWIILLIFLYIALGILNMPLSTLSFMIGGLSIGLGFGLKD
jgi:potassium-dependent mechanosensitive channel